MTAAVRIEAPATRGVNSPAPQESRSTRLVWLVGLPLALAAAAAAIGPFLGGYHLFVLTFAGVYAIVAVGNNLLLGHAGLVSLGQGGLLAVGAYAAGFAMRAGIPWYGALPISMAIAGFVGFAVGLPALRLSGHYLALVTLAFALAAEELIIVLQEYSGGVSGMPVTRGIAGPLLNYEAIVVVLGILLVSQNLLLQGRLGRILHLVRDSERAAAAAGINVAGTKLLAFTYSGVLAGAAGPFFVSATHYLTPSMFDLWLSVNLLVAVVLGGMNRPLGAAAGALFIAVLIQLSTSYQGLAPIIFGSSVLLFLLATRGSGLKGLQALAGRLRGPS
jgi:branched-chain amino acid transport system permease protein